MSELRQRNVPQDGRDAEIERLKAELAKTKGEALPATTPMHEELTRAQMMKEIQEKLLASVQRDIKPGLSHEAKKAKVALDKDPMNMELILNCGLAYRNEDRWDRTVNVLLRGYKRVSDLKDPGNRFEFLLLLAQGSLQLKQYKQAFAAFSDMEEPKDDENMLTYLVTATQTYGFNGDMAKALKSCNRTVELAEKNDDAWDPVFGAYCACIPALKRSGAYDAAKSSLMSKLKTDEMRSTLDALEKLSEIQEGLRDAVAAKPQQWKLVAVVGVIMLLGVFFGILYLLEKQSSVSFSK